MRSRFLFALVAVCALLMSAESFATETCYSATDTCQVCRNQSGTITVLDLGVCDTVRIGCPVCINDLAVGDSFLVPIYFYNDKKISAFSLPFRHYGVGLRFGCADYDGDPSTCEMNFDGATVLTTTGKAGIQFTLDEGDPDTDTANVLIGWLDMSGSKPIAANTTGQAKLLGSLYLVLADSRAHDQVVRFDTAFMAPAGEWIANNEVAILSGIMERPKFVICQNSGSPCDIALPVQEGASSSLPKQFELGQNVPNPFNPNTVIKFAVPKPSEVRVEVFNVLGQKVRTLIDEFSPAGNRRVEWDGTDDNGNSVASGVYLYRMRAGDFDETKKMLLLK